MLFFDIYFIKSKNQYDSYVQKSKLVVLAQNASEEISFCALIFCHDFRNLVNPFFSLRNIETSP